jgi:hypothetical protein
MEPFFGSGAVLLARPGYDASKHIETICDADGYIANVWRSIQADPETTAHYADWPVNHADLNARRRWLINSNKRLLENLIADPEYHDAKAAGWWIWAASCWIGTGLTRPDAIPNIARTGGVICMSDKINSQFSRLSERLRKVKVVCGDWSRICGGNWQDSRGDVGIFFDTPYSGAEREDVYSQESYTVAHDVRAWALECGAKPTYKIVLAGYIEEHEELLQHGWTCENWKAQGGGSNHGSEESQGKKNAKREALFYSPYCLKNTLF